MTVLLMLRIASRAIEVRGRSLINHRMGHSDPKKEISK